MSSVPQSALHWFEIPVVDMDRAQRFYETLLAVPLQRQAMGPQTLAVLPYARPGVGGALLAGPAAQPGTQGVVVYLDGGARLEEGLARLAEAGGQLLTPRVDLPDGMGSFVHFQDSEGNCVGLHAPA